MIRRVRALRSAALLLGLALAAGSAPSFAQGDSGSHAASVLARKVTLNVDGADLRAALKMLFNSVRADYVLDPEVEGRITASLTDIPFRIALDTVLRAAEADPPLTYRIEEEVFHVVRKPDPPPVPASASDAGGERVTATLGLRYADAGAVLRIVEGLALAPESLLFAGDTSPFDAGGARQSVHRYYWYQPPDGSSYVSRSSLGGRGGRAPGSGGGLNLGGLGGLLR